MDTIERQVAKSFSAAEEKEIGREVEARYFFQSLVKGRLYKWIHEYGFKIVSNTVLESEKTTYSIVRPETGDCYKIDIRPTAQVVTRLSKCFKRDRLGSVQVSFVETVGGRRAEEILEYSQSARERISAVEESLLDYLAVRGGLELDDHSWPCDELLIKFRARTDKEACGVYSGKFSVNVYGPKRALSLRDCCINAVVIDFYRFPDWLILNSLPPFIAEFVLEKRNVIFRRLERLLDT